MGLDRHDVSALIRDDDVDSGLSWSKGPSTPPLLTDTLSALLKAAARDHAGTDAIHSRHEKLTWTYAEFDRRVDAMAAGLLRLGLQPGERIGVWAPNCSAWTLVQFAAARAGLIFVTFNTAYKQDELEFVLRKTKCRALVMARGHKAVSYLDILANVNAPELSFRILIGETEEPGFIRLDDLLVALAPADVLALASIAKAVTSEDPANIQFTSGTTGRPKGVTLSHRSIVNNGYFVALRAGVGPGDRVCIPVPLYHCFGMVMGNLACVARGATMVYPGAAFDAGETLQAVADQRCTHLYGVPTMFIDLLAQPFGDLALESLRGGIMAGSPCPVEILRQAVERLHLRDVTIAYGMTETSPVSTQTEMSDSEVQRLETVGRVMPHLEVRIVDEEGRVVPRGSTGELCTRGYSVMLGYWQDPEATAQVLDDMGWMHSGDLAVMDSDAVVRIVGRKKDMIIRGGENISPREIEELLYGHPAISDVQVIGVPHARYGEEVCAWIVPRAGADIDAAAVLAFCSGRLAHYKVPRHIRFVDAFPKTASGKVQKFVLRQWEQDRARNDAIAE